MSVWRSRRGGISALAAFSLPLLIGIAAFAIDLGSVFMRSRQLQGVADAAALAAAIDPARAQALADASVTAANWGGTIDVRTAGGRYAPGNAPGTRFVAGSAADAVQVTLTTQVPVFFGLALLGKNHMTMVRSATAARARVAAFSVGSRLASVDGGIANAMLSALTGSSVTLSIADHQALAAADVDMFAVSDALRTRLKLTGASYDAVLDASMTNRDVLGALGDALTLAGNGTAAAAVRRLADAADGTALPLGKLVDFGTLGARDGRPASIGARVGASSLIAAALGLGSNGRQIAVDLGASVPGVAATRAWIAIGERPVNSPWLTVTGTGEPVIRTAQARIYLESIVGVPGLAQVKLPLLVDLAQAEARLDAIECRTIAGRAATIGVRPSPGTLSIAEVDRNALNDFGSDATRGPATLVALPLLKVTGANRVTLGGASGWQQLRFSQGEVDAGTTKSVATNDVTRSVASALVGSMTMQAQVLGLFTLTPTLVTAAIGAQLALVAPALDGVIAQVASLAGARIGEADVRVTGLRCGQPALVV